MQLFFAGVHKDRQETDKCHQSKYISIHTSRKYYILVANLTHSLQFQQTCNLNKYFIYLPSFYEIILRTVPHNVFAMIISAK